jgi:hypothetical protein
MTPKSLTAVVVSLAANATWEAPAAVSLPDEHVDHARALAAAELACAATGHAGGYASKPARHFNRAVDILAALDKSNKRRPDSAIPEKPVDPATKLPIPTPCAGLLGAAGGLLLSEPARYGWLSLSLHPGVRFVVTPPGCQVRCTEYTGCLIN